MQFGPQLEHKVNKKCMEVIIIYKFIQQYCTLYLGLGGIHTTVQRKCVWIPVL